MRMVYVVIIYALLVLLTISAEAKNLTSDKVVLLKKVAQEFNLSPIRLVQIAYVESHFDEQAIRVNKNGTTDIGMMQINSIHWDGECKMYNVFTLEGNVKCAAHLLTKHKKHKNIDEQWAARYHSKTPSKKQVYYNKLKNTPKAYLAKVE